MLLMLSLCPSFYRSVCNVDVSWSLWPWYVNVDRLGYFETNYAAYLAFAVRSPKIRSKKFNIQLFEIQYGGHRGQISAFQVVARYLKIFDLYHHTIEHLFQIWCLWRKCSIGQLNCLTSSVVAHVSVFSKNLPSREADGSRHTTSGGNSCILQRTANLLGFFPAEMFVCSRHLFALAF